MTLNELESDLYRRLGFAATPDPVVTTRLRAYLNQTQREIMSQKGLAPLRRAIVMGTSAPAEPYLGFNPGVVRIISLVDRSNRRVLMPVPLSELRDIDPGLTSVASTTEYYAVVSLTAASLRATKTFGPLSVKSNSATDGPATSVFVQASVGAGIQGFETFVLNGTAPVNGAVSTPIGSLVTSFSLGLTAGGGSVVADGYITLHEGAGATGPVLATIVPTRSAARMTVLQLYPTPQTANNYHADVELYVSEMAHGADVPFLPDDFHWVLTSGALLKEWQRMEKTSQYDRERSMYREGLGDLKMFVARAVKEDGKNGNGNGLHSSSFGPWYPVGGMSTAAPHAPTHEPGGNDPMSVDALPTIGSLRTLGSGPNQAAPGDDPRFTSGGGGPHHLTHESGGTDALSVLLLAGYPGGTTGFLRADASFATPATSGGAHHATHEPGGADALVLTSASRLFGRGSSSAGAVEEIVLGTGLAMSGTTMNATGAATPGAHHTTHEPGGTDVLVNNAWTNTANTFSQDQTISKAVPFLAVTDTSRAADQRVFHVKNEGATLKLQALTDDTTPQATPLTAHRNGDVTIAGSLLGAANVVRTSDARLADARTPTAHHATHEPGGADPMAVDAAAATGSLRTLGTGANQAAPGNDARFTAPSTPTAHATTHQPGGADAMAVDAAAAVGSLRTLGTGATQAAPGNDARFTAAPQLHATTHQPGGSDAMAVDAAAVTGSLRTLGTTGTSACAGNDARLSNARTPTAHATSHQPGGGDAMAVDAAAATGSLRTLGSGATQAAPGNDARFSDARAPLAHKTTHEPGGGDAMAVDAIAATGSLRTLGTGSQQACAGNDTRLTNSRTPTAHKTTHEPGGGDAMTVDAAAAVGSLRTLGTGANQAAPGNDTRFTAAPQLHAPTHKSGGTDAIKLDELAAPTDVTTLNATTGAHGLLRKLNGVATQFLDGTGAFSTPTAGVPGAHATTHQPGGGDPMAVDAAAATGSLRTLGTGANQAAPGNDSRFTAAPQAHHASHEPGGGDVLANNAWTNVANTFTENQKISRSQPELLISSTAAPANARQWRVWSGAAGNLTCTAVDDADALQTTALSIDRAGNIASGNITATGSGGNVACKDQANTFTQDQKISKSTPSQAWSDTSQPADQRQFDIVAVAQYLQMRALNDAGAMQATPLALSRAGDVLAGRDVFEKGRATAMGHPVAVAYSAGNFSALGGGTWTVPSGNVLVNSYTLTGKTAVYTFILSDSTVSGTVNQLAIINPVPGAGGYLVGTSRLGLDLITAYSNTGDGHIYLIRPAAANFPAATGAIWFTLMFILP